MGKWYYIFIFHFFHFLGLDEANLDMTNYLLENVIDIKDYEKIDKLCINIRKKFEDRT